MTKEQYDTIKQFAHSLTEKRLLMPDGQLLDQCQAHLDALVEHLAADFEEHPQEESAAEEHIEEEELPSGMFEAREPEPPPAPSPVHSEPKHEVRHKLAHKRPTPRKTHR